ncbi:hypothetical protein F0562_019527 [Nyssa sinensis]|uniref:RING-type domain-containing protein n=1 Tax=Nyssa sinensis TaxID=561372 RepID=A0A5J5BPI1_9ASTE|nr:hypothetical protein F0562_019527 [Nyssa sinensis]
MAVEARHLNLFPAQVFITNRDFIKTNEANAVIYHAQTGTSVLPFCGEMPETFLPFHQSLVSDSNHAKTSMKADSGLTYNLPAPRKRSRDISFDQFNNNLLEFSSFPGEDISLQIQQQQMEIDRILTEHTKKARLELEERQRKHARLLVSAIGEGIVNKLKEKDEQIQKMGKLNWVLQERVRSLYIENQLWRDLAQANEATANSLRINLEQVLAHVGDEEGAAAVADDAESCCDNSDYDGREEGRKLAGEAGGERKGVEDKEVVGGGGGGKGKRKSRMCRKCGERESCVLLLPCRHLCLCSNCGSTLHTCPVCNYNMDATVHVNVS